MPEIVQVDKLLLCWAEFEEELHSLVHGEESDERQIAEKQTTANTPSELSPEAEFSLTYSRWLS